MYNTGNGTPYVTAVSTIGANVGSFTHVSPDFYTVNYAYASGVAYYSNCPTTTDPATGNPVCTGNGTNAFDTYTTASMTSAINGLGLATVPLIYGGASNNGVDTGVQNILNNTNGAQTSFISSMVQEAQTNGYAGYNLDWEVGSGVDDTYAQSFVTFVNAFKAALAPLTLSIDAINSNIEGTYCSGNDGYLDFTLLSASSVDRFMFEDYESTFGTTSASCQTLTLSSSQPTSCPSDFTSYLNLMCSNLPAQMVVIGVISYSQGTNPFAGQAVSEMQSYGMDKIAVWPEQESGYPFLSGNGFVATQSSWYQLLASFLQ